MGRPPVPKLLRSCSGSFCNTLPDPVFYTSNAPFATIISRYLTALEENEEKPNPSEDPDAPESPAEA